MFDWTAFVVFFTLPWAELFVIVLFIQKQDWATWFEALKKPTIAPPLAWFRKLGCAACVALGGFGFLVDHLGNPDHAALHLSLSFYLLHLVLTAAFLVLFFEQHRLGFATIFAVAALVAFTVAFIAGALATAWSLLFGLPYFLLITVVSFSCGQIAWENASRGGVVVTVDNGSAKDTDDIFFNQ
jgi:tryptophan-rich sensory protein